MEAAASFFTLEVISSHDSTLCGLNCKSYENIECNVSCVVCDKALITETSEIFRLRNTKARVVVYHYFNLKPCGRVR